MTTAQLKTFFSSTTARLAVSYLGIIMLMSIGFSVVFYRTSATELARQVPGSAAVFTNTPVRFRPDPIVFEQFFQDRIAKSRMALRNRLIMLNALALVGGSFLSYYLARRTLRPVERIMEAQGRFAADASHELRTPLAVMQTEIEVALRTAGLTLPRAEQLLVSNLEEVVRLKTLSEGLLRLARNPGAEPLRQQLWLDDLANEAINAVLKQAQAKHIAIDDASPHVQVTGDQAGLAQALVVLLDNAIKYSGEHTTIIIDGHAHGKYASISVRDQGIGMSPKHIPHIFDRFYRVDEARTRQQVSGYGLGLSLAQKIVAQHGGEIRVSSMLDEGSVFTIRLPRS